jgi:hypothetical protein
MENATRFTFEIYFFDGYQGTHWQEVIILRAKERRQYGRQPAQSHE